VCVCGESNVAWVVGSRVGRRVVVLVGGLIERHAAQRRSGAHVRRCFINPGIIAAVFGPAWSRPCSNVIDGGGIRQKPSCHMGGNDACSGYGLGKWWCVCRRWRRRLAIDGNYTDCVTTSAAAAREWMCV